MPNQLNYPDEIPIPYIGVRPSRLTSTDVKFIQNGLKQILFGTTINDLIEIWVYDSNGSVAGHTNLYPESDSLGLITVVDNTGAYEMLDLDMGKIVRIMAVEPGRYGLVLNFFRNEVGSESGDHLYISDISDDRTELRLHPKIVSDSLNRDIYEWIVPSVPKEQAQGLIDQTFGTSDNFTDSQVIDPLKVSKDLDLLIDGTMSRVQYSNSIHSYNDLVSAILAEVHTRALDNMAADVGNLNIQDADLDQYLAEAVADVIREFKDQGIIDPRFDVF